MKRYFINSKKFMAIFNIVVHMHFTASQCTVKECESEKRKYSTCSISTVSNNQHITSMVVKEQLSTNDCVLNNSHGFYTRTIWVDKGCRAKFRVCYENIPTTTTTTTTTTPATTPATTTTKATTTAVTTTMKPTTTLMNLATTQGKETTESTSTSVGHTTGLSQDMVCSCPSSTITNCHIYELYQNYSTAELLNYFNNLFEEHSVKIDYKTTSVGKRKKISASDDRFSSAVIGWVGIFVCCLPVIFVVIIDITNSFSCT